MDFSDVIKVSTLKRGNSPRFIWIGPMYTRVFIIGRQEGQTQRRCNGERKAEVKGMQP